MRTRSIWVYQEGYGPDKFEEVGEEYKVTVLERGSLRVDVEGRMCIYNAHTWHSVDIRTFDEEQA